MRLHYETYGSGHPLLLIPGAWGHSPVDFKSQINDFSRDFQVIAVDPPGYGRSRPPLREFPANFFERDAAAIASLMSSLGHRHYSVVGWSDGAIVGLVLAGQKNRTVTSLVTCAGNSFINDEDIAFLNAVRDISLWPRAALDRVAYMDRTELARGWGEYCDRMNAIAQKGGDICTKALYRIACPCLVLHGDADMITSPSHARFLRDRIKRASMWVFRDAGHDFQHTHAREFNAGVLKFLKASQSGTPPETLAFSAGRTK